MWAVRSLSLHDVTYDFTSSAQGTHQDQSLTADGVVLVNGVNMAARPGSKPDEGRFQVIVCEDCGFPHCAGGGWIALRKIGTSLLWIPAFDDMIDECSRIEYQPPSAFVSRGFPIFRGAVRDELLRLLSWMGSMDLIRPLTLREAVLVVQQEAPQRMLGRHPDLPKIERRRVLSAAGDNVEERLDYLSGKLISALNSDEVAVAVEAAHDDVLHLDDAAVTEWRPMGVDSNGHPSLRLGPDLHVALPEGSA
jgi:hypothetical protein